jgi:hypothetical protein
VKAERSASWILTPPVRRSMRGSCTKLRETSHGCASGAGSPDKAPQTSSSRNASNLLLWRRRTSQRFGSILGRNPRQRVRRLAAIDELPNGQIGQMERRSGRNRVAVRKPVLRAPAGGPAKALRGIDRCSTALRRGCRSPAELAAVSGRGERRSRGRSSSSSTC